MRRVAFAIVVAVVTCMGAWIVLTTLSGRGDSGVVLSATGRAPQAGDSYTVVLRVVSSVQLDGMRQLMATDTIESLAEEHEFHFLELDDGSMAVCVGRFEDPNSPQITQLLSRFRDLATESGARPFSSALISRYRE